ncbi:MAG: hypothetical protein LBN97_06125 [Oscillospiraceae bacterium]|jgi:hypothetical protein|nr:hypothetical protein [Oscillospiraceae bacterium]
MKRLKILVLALLCLALTPAFTAFASAPTSEAAITVLFTNSTEGYFSDLQEGGANVIGSDVISNYRADLEKTRTVLLFDLSGEITDDQAVVMVVAGYDAFFQSVGENSFTIDGYTVDVNVISLGENPDATLTFQGQELPIAVGAKGEQLGRADFRRDGTPPELTLLDKSDFDGAERDSAVVAAIDNLLDPIVAPNPETLPDLTESSGSEGFNPIVIIPICAIVIIIVVCAVIITKKKKK